MLVAYIYTVFIIIIYHYLIIIEIDCDDDGGVVRISDALQAHMWPDMKMKKKGTFLKL